MVPGQERQIPDGGVQSGDRRAAVVWQGAEEADAGRVLSPRVGQPAAETYRGGLCRYVGAVPIEHRAVGSAVQDRLRQVSCAATCQRRHQRSAAGGVFPARAKEAGPHQREEVVAAEPLEESHMRRSWGTESAVSVKPAGLQSLPAEREPGEAVELPVRLWNYQYRGAMLNYLQRWMDQLKWQRLEPFEKLAEMLLKHVDGIANYCETKVRFGGVEALNGNIRMLINRGRGYQNLRYLLLKAKRLAVSNTEFIALTSVKKVA